MNTNPRCQHPPFKSRTQKPRNEQTQSQQQKPKQPQKQTKSPKQTELMKMIEEGVFHFYDFEYAAQFKDVIFPIEIGISTYNLKENKEISFYHKLLSPGKYKKQFDRTTFIHGINPQDPRLEANYTLIANELISYNNRFPGLSYYVSKEETLSGDKECIIEIFKRGRIPVPNNIRFITHIELFQMWCQMNNVNLTEKSSFILNHIFKQLECAERCSYHKTIDDKYHCALSDARHTALMELICVNHFGGKVNDIETLPKTIFVKSDWELSNTVALFTNCEYHSRDDISELAFTLVDLQSFETLQQQTFYLLPTGSIYSQTISNIMNLYHQNKWTNEMVINLMNSFIDSLQSQKEIIVVCLKGKITKTIPSLHITRYLNVSIVEFKKHLLDKLSQHHSIEKQKQKMFDTILADIPIVKENLCSIHAGTVDDCTFDETRRFIQTTQMLISNYPEMVQKYGTVGENVTKTTVVEIKMNEESKPSEPVTLDEIEDDEEDVMVMKSSKKVKRRVFL